MMHGNRWWMNAWWSIVIRERNKECSSFLIFCSPAIKLYYIIIISCNYRVRIIRWLHNLAWHGSLEALLSVQSSGQSKINIKVWWRLYRTFTSETLSISKNRDSTTALGSLFPFLTINIVKNFFFFFEPWVQSGYYFSKVGTVLYSPWLPEKSLALQGSYILSVGSWV